MKQSNLTEGDFMDAFRAYDRVNNFEYDGLRALYEYLTDLEHDTGEEMELDVIAICCDFNRWESLDEYRDNYQDCDTEDPQELDYFVCMIDDGPAFITIAH